MRPRPPVLALGVAQKPAAAFGAGAVRVGRPLEATPNQLLFGRVVVGGTLFVLSLALMSLLDQLRDTPMGVAAGASISGALATILVVVLALRARSPALAEFAARPVPDPNLGPESGSQLGHRRTSDH